MPINFNDTPENILNALEQIVTEIEDRLNVYVDKPVEQTSFSQIILSLEKSDCCAPCGETPTAPTISCDGYTNTLKIIPDLYYRAYGEEPTFSTTSGDVVISSSIVVPPPSSSERIVWSIEVDGKDTGLNTGKDDYIEDVVSDNSDTLGFEAEYIDTPDGEYLVIANISDAVKRVRLIPSSLPFEMPELRENPTATIDPATGIISFCIGKTEGDVPNTPPPEDPVYNALKSLTIEAFYIEEDGIPLLKPEYQNLTGMSGHLCNRAQFKVFINGLSIPLGGIGFNAGRKLYVPTNLVSDYQASTQWAKLVSNANIIGIDPDTYE